MKRHSDMRGILLVALTISVLFVRTGGAHLHLCFDGLEPPSSLHWADAGVHTDHDDGASEHEDVDLQLGDGLAKFFKTGTNPVFFIATLAALLLTFAATGSPLFRPIERHPTSPIRYFTPPAHAPPR